MGLNLIQKVALPIVASSVLSALLLLYVIPERQQAALEESVISELEGLAAAFGVSAQLAFLNQDLNALAELNTLVTSNPRALQVGVYIGGASSDVLLAAFPSSTDFSDLSQQGESAALRAVARFDSDSDEGRIEILYPRRLFNEEVSALNFPLYIVMGVFVVIQLWVYLMLARQIVRPLINAANFADQLGAGNDAEVSSYANRSDEVGLLQRALGKLQRRLRKQRAENDELLSSLETKVATRTKELEQALVAKDSFLASVSHELRTPLHSVIASLDLMEKGARVGGNEERHLKLARRGSYNLMELINELLDYQRFEHQGIKMYPESIAICEMVLGTYESMRPLFLGGVVDFVEEINLPKGLVVQVDKSRLSQILTNLIGNAHKFTPSGCVVFRSELMELTEGTAAIKFTVTDTGIGMDQPTLDRLGEAFFQANEGYNKSHQGTGLGLGIVKQILVGFGSKLAVESVLGEGSELSFEVSLPVIESPSGDDQYTQARGLGKAKKATVSDDKTPSSDAFQDLAAHQVERDISILYIEDSEINQLVMSALCDELPVNLTVVDSAKEGYQRVCQQHFDLIISDIQMPEFSGIDFIQWIKEDPGKNQGVPVVACTANATDEAVANFRRVGFDDVLTKPVTLELLEQFVRRQVARVIYESRLKE